MSTRNRRRFVADPETDGIGWILAGVSLIFAIGLVPSAAITRNLVLWIILAVAEVIPVSLSLILLIAPRIEWLLKNRRR